MICQTRTDEICPPNLDQQALHHVFSYVSPARWKEEQGEGEVGVGRGGVEWCGG